MDLRGDAAGATVSVRNFWQLYPKGLAADEDGLTVGICPSFPDDRYDREEFRDFEDRLFFYLMDGGYKLKARGWSPWKALERWWTGVPNLSVPVTVHEGAFTFAADGVTKVVSYQGDVPK